MLSKNTLRRICLCCLHAGFLFLCFLVPFPQFAQTSSEEEGEPRLISVFPFAGQKGQGVEAEVRGNWLDGASAVWFDHRGFTGRLRSVEEIEDAVRMNPLEKPKKAVPLYRALIEVQIDPKTAPGIYRLRLVSPRGISNPLSIHVVESSVTVEAARSHQTVDQAVAVVLPGVISGKIGKPGEVDFYSFQARKGQQLRFESTKGSYSDAGSSSGKFAQELTLYRAGGSWFDAGRPTRMLFEEERSSDLMAVEAQGTYRFAEDGQYFLQVAGVFGQGCPDCTYLVRVSPFERQAGFTVRSERPQAEWSERSLGRSLMGDWATRLEARSVQGSEMRLQEKLVSPRTSVDSPVGREAKQRSATPAQPQTVMEHEPSAQTESLALPVIVEGTIEQPGDRDHFKLKVEAGQKLAVEVEALEARPPYFNPRVGIVDSQDRELFSNVHRRLSMFNNNADPQVYLKAVEPKATYKFERGGEYQLQVRDMTSRYGGVSYRYRILIRSEIPHVGEVSVMAQDSGDGPGSEINRLNLTREEPKKLVLVASYEEGFTGDLSFTVSGLPEGVQAFPAVQYSDGRGPMEVTQNADIIAPKRQKAAMVLLAGSGAPLTTEPQIVRLYCQPISNAKLGPKLLVREIPLTVVAKQMDEEKPQPAK